MTINVQLRKGSVTVVPQSVIDQGLNTRETGEQVNVLAHTDAIVVVYPDGATVEEIERLTAAAQERSER